MIRYEIKNYLKNLLFVFLPALILYAIIVFIAFMLISNSILQMGNFLNSNITFEEGSEKELTQLATEYLKTIDFSKFFINLFSDIHYLHNLLNGFLDYLKSNSAIITEGTEALGEEYCRNIQNMVLAGLIVYLVGIFLTSILCSILIARRCKLKTGLKRTIIKVILSSIVCFN